MVDRLSPTLSPSQFSLLLLLLDVLLLSPRKWWHLLALDILLFSPVLPPPVLPAGPFLAEQFGRGGEAACAVQ